MSLIPAPEITWAIAAPLIITFVWGVALLLVDLFVPDGRKSVVGYLAIAGLLAAGLSAAPLWNALDTPQSTFNAMITLDRPTLIVSWLLLAVGVVSVLISIDYLPRQGIERGEYYVLLMFSTGGMLLLAQGSNLIIQFFGLELLSISLYILVGFAYPRITSGEAAMKYLLLGAFAAGFLIYGIALIFGATGTVDLNEIGALLQAGAVTSDLPLFYIGLGLVLVGLGFKVSMVPFHMWTPDVYEGSPTPVTAFMSVGTKAAAFAAMLRVLITGALPLQEAWGPILAVFAASTMIIGNIGALGQRNVKRMLAYSSIGHAGYILLGVIAGNQLGIEGFLYYLVAYGLTNLGAFAVLIALEQRGEANWDLGMFAGLWSRRPGLALAMTVFMLSLAGVPPTAGFFGKLYVFTAAYEAGLWWLVLIGVLTSAIAAFFYLRIIAQMFMREPAIDTIAPLDRRLAFGIGLSVVGVIVFGLLPSLIVDVVQAGVLLAAR
jgi:NADH-quinone oxidoreductase subunit N